MKNIVKMCQAKSVWHVLIMASTRVLTQGLLLLLCIFYNVENRTAYIFMDEES